MEKEEMKNPLRSAQTMDSRRMAGARALWESQRHEKGTDGAAGHRDRQFVYPVCPRHVHLHRVGQIVKSEVEALGCFAAEFNTIAIDDGIAMGHDGMLYSLPSREIIADSVEYMVNAHKADALVCISNCDKITPGMLMAAMRLNIPTIFVSGGPMEAGNFRGRGVDLIDTMVMSADASVSDADVQELEGCACPGCGSVFRNVYRQFDELPGRSHRNGLPRQRHGRSYARQPRGDVPPCGAHHRPDGRAVLPRRGRFGPAAFGGHQGGLRECNVARHRHGRIDQYGAAPAGHRPGSGRGLYDGRYRPPFAPGAGAVQGGAQRTLPRAGCQPRRRHHGDPGDPGPCRAGRYAGQPGGRRDPGRCAGPLRRGFAGLFARGEKTVPQCSRRTFLQ